MLNYQKSVHVRSDAQRCYTKGFVFKVALSVFLALGIMSDNVAQAGNPQATAPTSSYIQLNTYGALPVMVLNLTQSPINFNISTTSPSAYTTNLGPGMPIAAGLSGVYYPSGSGSTTTFTNSIAPGTAVDGLTSASLMPVATAASSSVGAYNYTSQLNFMNMFTLFPSWTSAAKFDYIEYVALSDVNNQGAAAYTGYTVLAGYPSAKEEKNAIVKSGNYTSAKAHNAASPTTASINLSLLNNNTPQAVYRININSLGAGTPSILPAPAKPTLLSVLNGILTVIGDVMVLADPEDIFFKASMAVGGLSSLQSMQGQLDSPGAAQTNVPPYTATAKGVNVSATATFNDGKNETFTLYQGDVDSLTYEVQPATIPLFAQNSVLVTTWRQKPYNTGAVEKNSTDMLIVAVINEGVYSAHQTSHYLSQAIGAQAHKPTREEAQTAAKFLGVLTNHAKEHPQDASYIVEMFGLYGKFGEVQKNPVEMKNLNLKLTEIFKKYDLLKHPNDRAFIEQCLARIESKR